MVSVNAGSFEKDDESLFASASISTPFPISLRVLRHRFLCLCNRGHVGRLGNHLSDVRRPSDSTLSEAAIDAALSQAISAGSVSSFVKLAFNKEEFAVPPSTETSSTELQSEDPSREPRPDDSVSSSLSARPTSPPPPPPPQASRKSTGDIAAEPERRLDDSNAMAENAEDNTYADDFEEATELDPVEPAEPNGGPPSESLSPRPNSGSSKKDSREPTPDINRQDRADDERPGGFSPMLAGTTSPGVNSTNEAPDSYEDERKESQQEDRSSVIHSKGVLELNEQKRKESGHGDRSSRINSSDVTIAIKGFKQERKFSESEQRKSRPQSQDVLVDLKEQDRKESGYAERKQSRRSTIASTSRSSRIYSKDIASDLNERKGSDNEDRKQSGRSLSRSRSRGSIQNSSHATPALNEQERKGSGSEQRNSRVNSMDATPDSNEQGRKGSVSKKRGSRKNSNDVAPGIIEQESKELGYVDRRSNSMDETVLNEQEPGGSGNEKRSSMVQSNDALVEHDRDGSGYEERKQLRRSTVPSISRTLKKQSKDVAPDLNERKSSGNEERKQSGRSNLKSISRSSRINSKDVAEQERKQSGFGERRQSTTSTSRRNTGSFRKNSTDVAPSVIEAGFAERSNSRIGTADFRDDQKQDENIETAEERKQSITSTSRRNTGSFRKNSTNVAPAIIEAGFAERSNSRIGTVDFREDQERNEDIETAVGMEMLGQWNANSEVSPVVFAGSADGHEGAPAEGEYGSSESRPMSIGAIEDIDPARLRISVPAEGEASGFVEEAEAETLGAGANVPQQDADTEHIRAETVTATERQPQQPSQSTGSADDATIQKKTSHQSSGISSEPGKLRPAGTVWLRREGSWRCPREYQRRQSEESRTTTLTSASKMMRVTRQPWGTIVPPTFELGHQKLPLKKIDNVVSRLYYVPKPKPLLGLEAQRRHSDLDKDTIDELVARLSKPQRPVPDADRRMQMSANYQKGVLGSYAWNGEPMFLTKI
ncbi:hypothetical protein LSAT2_000014 [Lamellibrachia satsuma]|nr:hypothetical protein LSAT2_000014 [Lamellibrachia satsuma]